MDEMQRRLVDVLVAASGSGTEKIPTERELARELGVNRATVREGLATLEVLGLIRRTQGSGTYIDVPRATYVQLYFEMAVKLGRVSIPELQQAREMIEREAVRHAALSATGEDIAAMEDCVGRMIHCETFEEGDEADFEFHLQLVRSTHNPVLSLLVEGLSSVLWDLLRHRRFVVRHSPEGYALTNRDHLPILHAIKNRDPERAVHAIDEHFRIWNEESRKAEEALREVEPEETA